MNAEVLAKSVVHHNFAPTGKVISIVMVRLIKYWTLWNNLYPLFISIKIIHHRITTNEQFKTIFDINLNIQLNSMGPDGSINSGPS